MLVLGQTAEALGVTKLEDTKLMAEKVVAGIERNRQGVFGGDSVVDLEGGVLIS